MMDKEPLAISAYLSTIVAFIVSKYLPDVDVQTQAAIVAIAVTGIVAIGRKFSFSKNTIREAGLDPQEVEADAADPAVTPKKKRASR